MIDPDLIADALLDPANDAAARKATEALAAWDPGRLRPRGPASRQAGRGGAGRAARGRGGRGPGDK
jgi:hypothetical protein